MGLLTNNITLDTIILCSIPLILIYLSSIWSFLYWSKKKVAYLKPSFPFGNVRDIILFQKPIHVVNQEMYNEIKYKLKKPFAGFFNMTKPNLMITEPELLRSILIKDFNVFVDRGLSEADEKLEPLQGHLFNKEGADWRKLRNKLSPTFTSGKIKYFFPLIEQCSKQLVETIKKNISDSNKTRTIDIKDYCARYTTDVIGSTAFGVEINSLENPDSEFRKISSILLIPSKLVNLKLALVLFLPSIKSFLSLKFMDDRLSDFFRSLVSTNISYREKNNIERSDFLNIMMQMKKSQTGQELKSDDFEITNDVIAAQSFVFFFAGFETSSSALTFCLYELARNKDVQSKLREEIKSVVKEFGELSYEAIQKMSYLDKISKETLRKYPSLPQLDRLSVEKYQIPDTDIILDAGTKVVIPTYAIHYDPEYYPDPEKFDPERFSQENIDARPHFTYLPFGDGPRNCVGLRFGIIQFKIGLAQLISTLEFDIDPSYEKIEYLNGSILLQNKVPILLKVKSIS